MERVKSKSWAWSALRWGLPASVMAAVSLRAVGGIPPTTAAGWVPLRCPLHSFFGIQCPTCGLGRSLAATWMGDWGAALHFHPLGPVVGALVLAVWLLSWTSEPVRSTVPAWIDRTSRAPVARWAAGAAVVVYAVWGFARNLF